METMTVNLTEDEAMILTLLALLGMNTMSQDALRAAQLMNDIMDESTPGPDDAHSGIQKLVAGLNVSGRGLLTLLPRTGDILTRTNEVS